MECLDKKKIAENEEIERFKKEGLMKTCNCCYDEEILPKNIVTCAKGCEFCTSCVEKSIMIAFSEGRLEYNCLSDCPESFTLQTIQVCKLIIY